MSGKFEYHNFHSALTQAALTSTSLELPMLEAFSPLNMDTKDLYELVQNRYGELAGKEGHTSAQENAAKAFGYEAAELSSIPAGANLGVSCGNPIALANIHEGETIIDLGSGGGIDILLAARKVGPKGQAIGVDMTKSMLDLARRNAEKAGLSNASFIEASITSIPLPASTASCIISNCVVNLVPTADKQSAFNEMYRLLKPGGRVAISDILTKKSLSEDIAKSLSLYVGCIAGAGTVPEYEEYLRNAGFQDVLIVNTKKDLNIYKEIFTDQKDEKPSCCQPEGAACESTAKPVDVAVKDAKEIDFNEWAGSFEIYALKQ